MTINPHDPLGLNRTPATTAATTGSSTTTRALWPIDEPPLWPGTRRPRGAYRRTTGRRRPTWLGYAAVAVAAFLTGLVTSSAWWLR